MTEDEELDKALLGLHNTCIIGGGGVGKSHLIGCLMNFFRDETLLVAPTGVAALNIGGETTHSCFGLSSGVWHPNVVGSYSYLNKGKYDLMKSSKLKRLVFDEAFMIRADKFEEINYKLQSIRQNKLPFGGLQVIVVGDPFQISPVLTQVDKEEFYQHYTSKYIFETTVWRECNFTYKELTKVYRQKNKGMIKHLENIRKGINLGLACSYFNQKTNKGKVDGLKLVVSNKEVETQNLKEFNKNTNKTVTYTGNLDNNILKEKELPVPFKLRLKKGIRVMFIKNKYNREGEPLWVNGDTGTVVACCPNYVIVKMDRTRSEVLVGQSSWGKIERVLCKTTGKVEEVPVATYRQIPLKIAYAVTLHKCQGMTLNAAQIDLSSCFSEGLAYVALSRCRSIDGINLLCKLKPSMVKVNREAVKFYNDNF